MISVSARALESTPCEPYGDPFPSSSSGGVPFAIRRAAPAVEGMVRVPSVNDPKVWRTIALNLSQPWRVLQLPTLGWIITFLQVPAGPVTPVITPASVPTHVVEPADKALSASVILPESGGFNQYWVPVLEKYRWAQLQTPFWTVVFLRTPMA